MLDELLDYKYLECLFTKPNFNLLNRDKCDEIHLIKTNDLALITGKRGNELYAPFSAPFSFVLAKKENLKYSCYKKLFATLKDEKQNFDLIKITLPPDFYFPDVTAKIKCSLTELGFRLSYRDINSHFDLCHFDVDLLGNTAKKTIRAANKHSHKIYHSVTDDEKKLVYDIIKENRENKGYPLRMSWAQVKETIDIVAEAKFFYVKTDDELSAAAIVFDVTDNISQVIYWGAIGNGERNKVMYFLPFELIKIYKAMGKKILDIGPCSENGIISEGLNDFKQMIGCINSVKETWEL